MFLGFCRFELECVNGKSWKCNFCIRTGYNGRLVHYRLYEREIRVKVNDSF